MKHFITKTRTYAETADPVRIIAYDTRWPECYEHERAILVAAAASLWVHIEHIGSTAVPGLCAKPVIDLMAAVQSLEQCEEALAVIIALGYRVLETGMSQRLFLRRRTTGTPEAFHLHVVELSTWEQRKERLLRDYLLASPDGAALWRFKRTARA